MAKPRTRQRNLRIILLSFLHFTKLLDDQKDHPDQVSTEQPVGASSQPQMEGVNTIYIRKRGLTLSSKIQEKKYYDISSWQRTRNSESRDRMKKAQPDPWWKELCTSPAQGISKYNCTGKEHGVFCDLKMEETGTTIW